MIEILATGLGVAGAVLNCQPPGKWRRLTFGCWLPSNIILMIWSLSIGALWVAGLYAVYTVTSSWGLWHS
ncbi:MAG: hypothetical protein EHM40_23655 [Chloroflexi bacterium]|nr:MAG: hypothetical protein EHM40_23655 [Chloroflexota bacterium]